MVNLLDAPRTSAGTPLLGYPDEAPASLRHVRRVAGRFPIAIDLAAAVLGSRPVSTAFDRLSPVATRVLAMHDIQSKQQFERNLATLTSRYTPVRGADLLAGGSPLPPRSLLMTFDDAHASTVEIALPILRERRIPAVLFVCPGILSGSRTYWWDVAEAAERCGLKEAVAPHCPTGTSLVTYLKSIPDEERRGVIDVLTERDVHTEARAASLDQVQRWMDAGLEIGNHTWDHPCLDRCAPSEQRRQIELAHEWLTSFLGEPARMFAYPNGDWTPDAEQVLMDLGYESGFLFDHRLDKRNAVPLRHSRLRLNADATAGRARAVASGAHSFVFGLAGRRNRQLKTSNPVATSSGSASNLEVFDAAPLVASYDPHQGLTPAEAELVARWIPERSKILDLGVGTGHTYPALAGPASSNIGVDYSPDMVQAAATNFPEAHFEVADASDLSGFEDGFFDAVVFPYNGLDYLHSIESRQQALAEVRRVLRPGGTFLMSTHNPRAVTRLPSTEGHRRPTARQLAVAAYGLIRATRALLPSKIFWRGSGDERDRVQPRPTYHATPQALKAELRSAGFEVLQELSGDHRRRLRGLVPPWTYVAAVKPMFGRICVEWVDDAAGQEGLAAYWDRLADHAPTSFFQTRAWSCAWIQTFAQTAPTRIAVAKDAATGEIIGLLPLTLVTRRLRQDMPVPLRYWAITGSGPGAADHVGPVTADVAVGATLFREARHATKSANLYLESLADKWVPIALANTDGRVVRRTECPANTRTASGAFADSWSSKVKKNERRRQRMLSESSISPRWVPAGPGFAEALSTLRELHGQRWQRQGRPGLFDGERARFLLDVADRAKAPNIPWVLLLEKTDEHLAVAGLLGFVHQHTFSVYKTGWNPEFSKLGLGMALGAEAMRWAEVRGLTTFDYLRGPRAHKFDLGCTPRFDVSVLARNRTTGRLLEWRERMSADGVRTGCWARLR